MDRMGEDERTAAARPSSSRIFSLLSRSGLERERKRGKVVERKGGKEEERERSTTKNKKKKSPLPAGSIARS